MKLIQNSVSFSKLQTIFITNELKKFSLLLIKKIKNIF
jgi:hypothetical protein